MFFIEKFAPGRNHGKRKVAEKANGNQENGATAEGVATTIVAASVAPRLYFQLLPTQCGHRLHVKSVAIAFQASSGQCQTAESGERRVE